MEIKGTENSGALLFSTDTPHEFGIGTSSVPPVLEVFDQELGVPVVQILDNGDIIVEGKIVANSKRAVKVILDGMRK